VRGGEQDEAFDAAIKNLGGETKGTDQGRRGADRFESFRHVDCYYALGKVETSLPWEMNRFGPQNAAWGLCDGPTRVANHTAMTTRLVSKDIQVLLQLGNNLRCHCLPRHNRRT